MKQHKFILIGLIVLSLLLIACGSSTTSTSTGSPHPTQSTLGDNSVRSITRATQSGDFHTPLDSTPDVDGTTIYFTASSSHGAGVFRVPAAGGPATSVFVGSPFVTPRGIAISPDGKQLYVTDLAAGDKGEIFVVPVSGGSPSLLQGSMGTMPQNLDVVNQNGQQLIYFTGKDPQSGQSGVFTLPVTGAKAPTVVVKGAPLVNPDGVVVTQSGIIYVSDQSAAGQQMGKVFKIAGGNVTAVVDQVRTGDPAGIALSENETILLVSAIQLTSSGDQVLLIDLNTLQTGSVSKVVGQNNDDAGGLHASPGKKNILSWCGKGGGSNGTVYTVQL